MRVDYVDRMGLMEGSAPRVMSRKEAAAARDGLMGKKMSNEVIILQFFKSNPGRS